MEEVFREPTAEEKVEMTMLNPQGGKFQETVTEKFKRKVNEKEAECTRKRIPFCRRCAILDFKKQIEDTMRAKEEDAYEVDMDKYKVKFPDLSLYCDPKNFKAGKEWDAFEKLPRVVAGQTTYTQIKVGVHKDYVCNKRKCGISIFVPIETKEVKEQ